jgi:hypothetical protein
MIASAFRSIEMFVALAGTECWGPGKASQHRERRKRSQFRLCLFCGKAERPRRWLEIHHVVKQAHGGSDAWENMIAVCHGCHRLIHNVERPIPFVGRLMLALQVLGPRESRAAVFVCRLLFRWFLARPSLSILPVEMRYRPVAVEARAEEAA